MHSTDTLTKPDPLDQLVPPQRPWWARLVIASLVVAFVGTVSVLFGRGHLYPRPDCCGSGSGSPIMALAPDGRSVMVSSFFFNSSDATLVVHGASVRLPGAHVRSVGVSVAFDPLQQVPLPAIIPGHGNARIVVTFVPDSCIDTANEWGTIDLRLDVRNGWLPSLQRTYRVRGHITDANNDVSVLPPNDDPSWSTLRTPLAAACALLAAKP